MTDAADELITAIELHAPERLRAALAGGIDATAALRGKTPMQWLLEMYTRSTTMQRSATPITSVD
jgi:hypothetical protein